MTQNQNQRRRHRGRSSAVCHIHPSKKATAGCCASCLRERLATIEVQSSSSSAVQVPELRRTQSYSSREASDAIFMQPRRRSCDVGPNVSSLQTLFVDDGGERWEGSIRMSRVPDLKEELEGEASDEKQKKLEYSDSEDEGGERKTMKELIDLERGSRSKKSNGKDLMEIASVLGKKLKILSVKNQKSKKKDENLDARFAGTSEIHGYGRRSCDVDPRLSVDAGRVSFEEPRASWDGCLVGKTYPKLPPLSSVIEDSKSSPENIGCVKDDDEEKKPGGTAQTRDYYCDSRRRRSFERSCSIKRPGLLEVDELKTLSNAKVSPEAAGLFHGAKLLVTEKELKDSDWYSIKNHKPETVRFDSKGIDCAIDGSDVKTSKSKWPKGWRLWGMIQRKKQTKNENKPEKSLKLEGNAIEGSLAESLLKLRRVGKGEGTKDVSEKLIKSYSISARKSCDGGVFSRDAISGGFEGGRSSCDGMFHGSINGGEGLCEDKQRQGRVLEMKNVDGDTYGPENLENGLFRFYLTPLRIHKTSRSSRLIN